jgi:hypothetical protein
VIEKPQYRGGQVSNMGCRFAADEKSSLNDISGNFHVIELTL